MVESPQKDDEKVENLAETFTFKKKKVHLAAQPKLMKPSFGVVQNKGNRSLPKMGHNANDSEDEVNSDVEEHNEE